MSTISLRLPASLHGGLRELAHKEGVSMNQLIVTAVAEKLSALQTEEYLEERASRASRESYERALSKIGEAPPIDEDVM